MELLYNSNTTIVKVKFELAELSAVRKAFKYNDC